MSDQPDGATSAATDDAPATILVLTEEALDAGDAGRISELHGEETLRYRVLVPADTEHSVLAEVIDHVSMLEFRGALNALRHKEPSDSEARVDAGQALASSVEALRTLDEQASGEVTEDDPIPALQEAVERYAAREVVVVTRPHAVEDTFHRDWASRARDVLGVPVLHVYAGTTFLG